MFLKQADSQGCSCRNPSHAAGPEQQPIYSSYPSRLSRSLWCEEQQAEGKKKARMKQLTLGVESWMPPPPHKLLGESNGSAAAAAGIRRRWSGVAGGIHLAA